MTARNQQLASSIRHAVQAALARGLQDPRVRGLISITGVEVSPDHAEAYVSVSVLPAEAARLSLAGLESAAPRLGRDLGRSIRTRRIPRLVFRLDDSIKKMAAFESALALDRASAALRSTDDNLDHDSQDNNDHSDDDSTRCDGGEHP